MKTQNNRSMRAVAFLVIALFLLMAVFPVTLAAAPRGRKGPKKPVAKNVIVMIADGWDQNHINASSYYQYGKAARQVYNRFPFRYAMSTYMGYKESDDPCYGWGYDPSLAWISFDYVKACYTDSAAAATTMSTGKKTFGGASGVDLNDQPLLHAL